MKIGILTFHCAHNYGAVLQAYALSSYLGNEGYNVEIIDYRSKAIVRHHEVIPSRAFRGLSHIKNMIRLIQILLFSLKRYKRAKVFDAFINSLPLSERKYAETKSLDDYDYIICGSDQIWNPSITKGYDSFYTGQVPTCGVYISYAASMELTLFTDEQKTVISSFLKNFRFISVRESVLKDSLLPLIENKVIYQVLDPVFLLTKQQWHEFSSKNLLSDKYVLLYQVRRDKRCRKLAEGYSHKHNLKVVEITAEAEHAWKANQLGNLNPHEFVGLFENASAVVTTSFHGTAFSVLFNRPFKTVLFGSPGDGRALDLINSLGIKDCTIPVNEYQSVIDKEWEVNSPLKSNEMLNESKFFLQTALSLQ